jgi:hypothetical protein
LSNFATLCFLIRQHWGGCRYRQFAANLKVLFAMEPWPGVQSDFAVKAFYKNGDSFVIAQREFRREFGVNRNCAVPSVHAIKTWVRNFEATGLTLYKKGGSVKAIRRPENIAAVRESSERSTHSSARRPLCHSDCLKPAFGGFYTKIFTSIPTKLKLHRIQQEVKRIPVEVLQRVTGDVCKRLAKCLEQNGGH